MDIRWCWYEYYIKLMLYDVNPQRWCRKNENMLVSWFKSTYCGLCANQPPHTHIWESSCYERMKARKLLIHRSRLNAFFPLKTQLLTNLLKVPSSLFIYFSLSYSLKYFVVSSLLCSHCRATLKGFCVPCLRILGWKVLPSGHIKFYM